jgi:hypothetical protein
MCLLRCNTGGEDLWPADDLQHDPHCSGAPLAQSSIASTVAALSSLASALTRLWLHRVTDFFLQKCEGGLQAVLECEGSLGLSYKRDAWHGGTSLAFGPHSQH